ncbi:hypothetical protein KW076_00615 [Micrococcus porci]|uniref:hypothetical protein n=1 Tax=Micrococcus porci TaxID=2856555 RepID=UPI001CC92E41|nr:hypothetical protein [Micrococcus porci]UBH24738.1 hypothetical protein KW076_00615 [Micrococcus porci]
MILARIPRRSARRAVPVVEATQPPVRDRSREVSPLGPALAVALGGVVAAAARGLRARTRRAEAADRARVARDADA